MIGRLLLLFGFILITGCATTTPVDISGTATQLETRQIQTRQYDTLNKALTMRSVVATLQDHAGLRHAGTQPFAHERDVLVHHLGQLAQARKVVGVVLRSGEVRPSASFQTTPALPRL